jgi:dihydropyrimidinase
MFTCFSERGMRVTDDQILRVMRALAARGCLAMVHAENEAIVDSLEGEFRAAGHVSPDWYPRSRPPISEAEAVFRVLSLAETAECSVYLVHLSARESLEVVAWFRRRGRITIHIETCTHYLLMTDDEYARQGGLVRISPPLRKAEDVAVLWKGVQRGDLNVVASDGSGQTLARKGDPFGDIFEVPYGMPGVQFMVPLVADEAMNRRGISPMRLAEVFSENPAKIFGLYPRKGLVAVGSDADLLIFDHGTAGSVTVAAQLGNSDYSPYAGRRYQGAPAVTLQRGHVVLEEGAVRAKPGDGEFVATTPQATRTERVAATQPSGGR